MVKPNMARLIRSTRTLVTKHSPEILTGIGIAGMVTTTVLAVKATPKALALIEEEKRRRWKASDDGDDSITNFEVTKLCWKCYIPAVVTGVASTACLIGASSVSAKRTAALAAAYQLSETALSEYRDKVIETIGEKKERTVREKVSEERVKQNPVNNSEVIISHKGDTLFLEPVSKRYFMSDIENVRRAENMLNKQMLHDISGYVSLSDFYDEIGLDHTDMSDGIGWNVNELINIDFHAALTEDEKPCIALYYTVPPRYGFEDFM